MKAALVLEKYQASTTKTCQILKMLGYLSAPARTAEAALAAAGAIRFDVIVTFTPIRVNERRSLTGELKRMAPLAAVVLITENEEERTNARRHWYAGLSAVLSRRTLADDLRRVIEFGIDGYGLQPAGIPKLDERRRATVKS